MFYVNDSKTRAVKQLTCKTCETCELCEIYLG